MPSPSATIQVLCLAYGNHAEVCDYVNRLLDGPDGDRLRIVVTDNTPGRDTTDLSWVGGPAARAHSSGRLVIVGDGVNHGYFGGFRRGLREAFARWPDAADWTILSNTDLSIRTAGWIRELDGLAVHNSIIAPKVISGLSGKNQNPIYLSRPRPLKFLVLSWIFRFGFSTALYRLAALYKDRLISGRLRIQKDPGEGQEIYGAHGSFICIPKSYFDRGGQLECKSFLYVEEICLAEEARRLGIPIRYSGLIEVVHDEHASTSFIPPPHIRRYLAEAHYLAYRILQT
jgi:Predicted glycosyltransferases